jgi:hypothetical protein
MDGQQLRFHCHSSTDLIVFTVVLCNEVIGGDVQTRAPGDFPAIRGFNSRQ